MAERSLPLLRLHLRVHRRQDALRALRALEVAAAAAIAPWKGDYVNKLAGRLEREG